MASYLTIVISFMEKPGDKVWVSADVQIKLHNTMKAEIIEIAKRVVFLKYSAINLECINCNKLGVFWYIDLHDPRLDRSYHVVLKLGEFPNVELIRCEDETLK